MKKLPATILLAVALIAAAATAQKKSGDAAFNRNISTFNAIVRELRENYVDSLRAEEAFEAAIDAFLATVDPYTEYYPADEKDALQKMTTGEYGGIGAYLMDRDSSTYISAPMQDSPATLAGIRHGDRILRIDSADVSRRPSSEVTTLLRGIPDTPVLITLSRKLPDGSDSTFTAAVTRRLLQQPSMPYHAVIGNTGYILLNSFINKSPAEVAGALAEFKADPRVKNIVLDLRGNGGGLVESAVDILSDFLPKGTEVVRTRGRDDKSERIYKTTRQPLFPDIPLAILIDGGTASASEILAGAIQDLDRGILVGSRSFGKGLVQSTRPLPFQGLLKVTVAKYYTPSGRLIQALDYAHRNEDGSVSRIPDSLTHAYKTLRGRTIRDGGGLQPDTVVPWPKAPRLVYNLVRDNWIFDYATRYAQTHPSALPATEFVVSDTVWSDFKASVDPARFQYDRVMEDALRQLRDLASEEGYNDSTLTAAFDSLQPLLVHDLNRDLDTHRSEIDDYLGSEIMSRYWYDVGKIAYALRSDKAFETARDILASPLYNRLLEAPVNAKTTRSNNAKGVKNVKNVRK